MIPPLGTKGNHIPLFGYHIILTGARMDITYHVYIRMIFYFFLIAFADRK